MWLVSGDRLSSHATLGISRSISRRLQVHKWKASPHELISSQFPFLHMTWVGPLGLLCSTEETELTTAVQSQLQNTRVALSRLQELWTYPAYHRTPKPQLSLGSRGEANVPRESKRGARRASCIGCGRGLIRKIELAWIVRAQYGLSLSMGSRS